MLISICVWPYRVTPWFSRPRRCFGTRYQGHSNRFRRCWELPRRDATCWPLPSNVGLRLHRRPRPRHSRLTARGDVPGGHAAPWAVHDRNHGRGGVVGAPGTPAAAPLDPKAAAHTILEGSAEDLTKFFSTLMAVARHRPPKAAAAVLSLPRLLSLHKHADLFGRSARGFVPNRVRQTHTGARSALFGKASSLKVASTLDELGLPSLSALVPAAYKHGASPLVHGPTRTAPPKARRRPNRLRGTECRQQCQPRLHSQIRDGQGNSATGIFQITFQNTPTASAKAT